MTFEEWIKREGLTYAAAADRIGAASATVARRYAKGLQIPNRDFMKRIYGATNGAVTANDFYGHPPPSQESVAA
jgi:hypothetical protein